MIDSPYFLRKHRLHQFHNNFVSSEIEDETDK